MSKCSKPSISIHLLCTYLYIYRFTKSISSLNFSDLDNDKWACNWVWRKYKKKECLIALSSHRIYKKKHSCFYELVYEITLFYVWHGLFSHSSFADVQFFCVDRILVVTVQLVSTCCPLRISCTYHHQTYSIPHIRIWKLTRTLSVSQISCEIFSNDHLFLLSFYFIKEKKKIWK